MAYWEWGDPVNPRALVCVHGLTRQGRDFDTLARALCHHYRVVCPDVVGRGESDWLPDPMAYGVPTYVADMVTLLARLNAQTVDWVGTSMGGLIGMALASLPQQPLRRLVLNDVGPRVEFDALERIGRYVGDRVTWSSFEEAAAALRLVGAGFGPHTPSQWEALTRHHLKQDSQGLWMTRYDPAIALPFKALSPEMAAAGEAHLGRHGSASPHKPSWCAGHRAISSRSKRPPRWRSAVRVWRSCPSRGWVMRRPWSPTIRYRPSAASCCIERHRSV